MTRRHEIYECYGFRVECEFDLAASGVLERFFGAPPEEPPRGTTLRLTVRVRDSDAATVEPPHTLEVIAADPIIIDAGSSHAVLEPQAWRADVTLACTDLDDPIVWGRWLFERLFLYLVCRSPRHYPLHAGAIAADGRVAAISAATGVGKSTFTWWAHRRGAQLLGEDILVRHLDDPLVRLWGYSRALYLSGDILDASPELAGAERAPVDGGGKYRVETPCPPPAGPVSPSCLVFLARDGDPQPRIRRLDSAEGVERSRSDFSTAKNDPAVLAAVSADLLAGLEALPVFELALAPDLDASYELLRSALQAI